MCSMVEFAEKISKGLLVDSQQGGLFSASVQLKALLGAESDGTHWLAIDLEATSPLTRREGSFVDMVDNNQHRMAHEVLFWVCVRQLLHHLDGAAAVVPPGGTTPFLFQNIKYDIQFSGPTCEDDEFARILRNDRELHDCDLSFHTICHRCFNFKESSPLKEQWGVRAKFLAFAMASHTRLGGGSSAHSVGEDLLRQIAGQLRLHEFPTSLEWLAFL